MVAYRMLGALEATEDGVSADLGPPKQRALLAVLLLHPNEIVPVDALIDLLWPDEPPRTAQHAVQVYVSELRGALAPLAGEEVIAWRSPGYILAADPEAIDTHRFERLVTEGVRGAGDGDPSAASTFRDALGLWRGPPLADFVYEEFAQPEIRRLTETRLQAMETLASLELTLGGGTEALALAQTVALEDPLRERGRELQMLALYRVGRHADALRVYEDLRRGLAEELGAEPSPSVRDLQERILLHDPTLGEARHDEARDVAIACRNPYKGLRPFGEEDAGDFFGREALVRRLEDELARGIRLVALVGPSGCGKSSILNAGLVPRLRAAGQVRGARTVAPVRPGARATEALEAALEAALRTPGRLVLVIDQFEDVFTGSGAETARLLAEVVRVVGDPDGAVSVVLALRADAYDRPLLHAGFAPVFLAGVVNVVPMTAGEIEDAVLRPAQAVGLEVEPGLLAELVADTVDRPGALPLLQHTLAELFDRRARETLTLEAYRQLGGLRAALARRAEATLLGLDEERRAAARQVFLRLVRIGDGPRDTVRRVPVRELTGLGLDPVALSDVLVAFDRGRLVSFDRDAVSGDATVEVAHEALLTAWERLAAWIDEQRADLGRRASLALRTSEWIAGGQRPEDLLAGARLDELAAWSRATTLRLTAEERGLLDASLARREAEIAASAAQAAAVRRLERRARVRLAGFIAVVALLAVTAAWVTVSWPGPAPSVVLVYPGPGDGGMYDSIAAAFNEATDRLDLDAQVVVEGDSGLEDRLRRLAGQGVDLVVVGHAWSNPAVERAARDLPGTRFVARDYAGELPNVSTPAFAYQEGAFLVGAAAALQSRTGVVAIINDIDADGIWPYPAGFAAGAREINPAITVLTSYLVDSFVGIETRIGFLTVNREARRLYEAGADVVFYAGDMAPLGVFEAAYAESSTLGRHLWAVALDTDWYVVLPLVASGGEGNAADWRPHVLTSLVTRYDLGYAALLADYARGTLATGDRRFGLTDGVFELAESGGFLAAYRPALDALREQVIAGRIEVPAIPDDRGPPRPAGAIERFLSVASHSDPVQVNE
jgi:DNA-binding SARP family transcriptional activator/basic membrane lipoprotein Med (substrate-binding protein (PBP1-ABC) superfamily)